MGNFLMRFIIFTYKSFCLDFFLFNYFSQRENKLHARHLQCLIYYPNNRDNVTNSKQSDNYINKLLDHNERKS